MGLALLLLLIVLLFGGFGFAVHFLWILAVILLVLWVVGFLAHGAERSWYRW
ncbi:MAG TPA: hypothetical protein VNF07_04635 [Acidimicrobiales bacterium]|nr:hypothetical protein [Acidimicrobiales bacterium]